MANLIVEQKTIKDLFQDKKSNFLIPDYQRPYAWGETECQTLWDVFVKKELQQKAAKNTAPAQHQIGS